MAEHPRRPYQLDSPILRRHGLTIARAGFERSLRAWPELVKQFGQRGRDQTEEDFFWHLDYLDTAVEADAPAVFEEYADWLSGLLIARGLQARHIAGSFELLAEEIERLACPPRQASHRQGLVDLLRRNRDRILGKSTALSS
ncbi:hypothetical protein BH23PLA1_BH23PLA1_39810 [soil metagenome]